ncbi:MAG TPA: methyltransferase domain-containing protein [Actinomycetota bacterium]|nr:methyltransferase domain-containing protein [Actinomycetota bacterium]
MDPEVLAHYTLGIEEPRLTEGGSSRIEFARTKELLARHLPGPPAQILDVGGGPGRYSSWLADRGYDAHLVDVVPLHVEQATARAASGPRFTAELGDARNISAADERYDAVLLMGPLYHLSEQEDRVQALSEARRVVRVGGLVFAAAISRFGSLLDGLKTAALTNPDFRAIVKGDLASGQHDNPTERPEWFTTAFFHHPDELREEIQAAGLSLEAMYGVEGPGWLLWERWDDEQDRENILRVARAVETETTVIGVSLHFLAVSHRQ